MIWSPARPSALAVGCYLGYFQMAVDINPLPNTYKNLLTDKTRSGDMKRDTDIPSPGGVTFLSYLFSVCSVDNLSFVASADMGGVDRSVHVVILFRPLNLSKICV